MLLAEASGVDRPPTEGEDWEGEEGLGLLRQPVVDRGRRRFPDGIGDRMGWKRENAAARWDLDGAWKSMP